MPFTKKCWRRPLAALVIATSSLSACARAGFDEAAACPPVVEYSRAEQMQVAAEVAVLPEAAMLINWLADYAVLREQVRACHETKP